MAEQQRYQPSTETVRRHQPGGPFMVEHFLNYPDHRTHVERLNPLRPNESFGYSPGAQRGFQDLPLQTYNTNDTPIGAQFPAGVEPAPQPIAEEEEMTPERIAEVCHEVNRSICEAAGDHSQKAWAEASDDQRKSCLAGILFALEHPDATPEDQHKAWMDHKIADGWIHGPEKDEVLKRHPCLVPYEELPFEQRVKDHAFRAVVHALAPRLAT